MNGENAAPLYKYLRENSSLAGADISWNFGKFLCNADGEVVKYYEPDFEPNQILPDIEDLLEKSKE